MIRFGVSGKRRAGITADDDEPLYAVITSVAPGTFVPTGTHQIAFTAFNRFGGVVSSPENVSYATSNAGVATVDSDGLVTAVADGSVTITVTISAIILTVALTVTTPVATVDNVVVTGPTTVQEGQDIILTAEPRDGSTPVLNRTVTWSEVSGAGDVTLSADSGIDPHTVTVTGVTDGSRLVKATCDGVDSSNFTITVTNPPGGGGAYSTIAEKLWYGFANKGALAGLISTESQLHSTWKPVLPVTDWYDFPSVTAPDKDGTMATRNVIRYNRGLNLNSAPLILTARNTGTGGNSIRITVSAGTSSGRKYVITDDPTSPTVTETFDNLTRPVAIAAFNSGSPGINGGNPSTLISVNTGFNDAGPTLMPGWSSGAAKVYALTGGAIGVAASFQMVDNLRGRIATHSSTFAETRYVGVRTFFRMSANWEIGADVGGEAGASYKMLFLRNANSRTEFEPNAGREWVSNVGAPQGGGTVTQVTLAHHNVVTMNANYGVTGFPQPDIASYEDGSGMMFKTPPQPPGAPTGDGEEEWYELRWIVEYEVGGDVKVMRQTQALRQYTQSLVANPLPWRYNTVQATAPVGSVWRKPTRYEQGVYSNRQADETMWQDFACYEVVDLDAFTPPWIAELGIV